MVRGHKNVIGVNENKIIEEADVFKLALRWGKEIPSATCSKMKW